MATGGRDPSPSVKQGGKPVLAFLLLAVFMLGFMAAVFALGIRSTIGKATGPEHYVSTFAGLLPFGYAFGAGMVASVNPCGFLMLPAVLGYYLGTAPGDHPADVTFADLGRGILFGLLVTLGFVALFAAIGAVFAAGSTAIIRLFPWLGLSVGILMAALGGWLLLTGRSLGLAWASRIAPPKGRGLGNALLYGVAYGAASLSCTLPIFLVVVSTSLASQGFWPSLGQFTSFGLGMGAVITTVSLSAVAFRGAVGHVLRGMAPHVHRLSAVFLAGAGAYLIIYWVVLGDIFH
ncbi:MAG: cytochrome c biogenesis protein CcdA [Dehalococcoidia bacterium]|nr:cytochrome c biogenesis protein CcdA [Dehalococcoidia bacterium]